MMWLQDIQYALVAIANNMAIPLIRTADSGVGGDGHDPDDGDKFSSNELDSDEFDNKTDDATHYTELTSDKAPDTGHSLPTHKTKHLFTSCLVCGGNGILYSTDEGPDSCTTIVCHLCKGTGTISRALAAATLSSSRRN